MGIFWAYLLRLSQTMERRTTSIGAAGPTRTPMISTFYQMLLGVVLLTHIKTMSYDLCK